jgi:hypothetical protein
MLLLGTEGVVGRPQVFARSGAKLRPGLLNEPLFERDYGIVVDHVRGEVILAIVRLQKPVRDQASGTDEQTVAGEGR